MKKDIIPTKTFSSSLIRIPHPPFEHLLPQGEKEILYTNLPGSNTHYNSATGGSIFGGNANVGYKFMPFFAAEVGYTAYANTEVKNGTGAKAGHVRSYSYDLAGKGIIPIGGSGFEAFAKL